MLKRSLALLALLASVGTASADDIPWGYPYDPMGDSGLGGYVGLRGSMAWSDDVSTSSGGTSIVAAQDLGFGGSLYGGTHLPFGLRLEGEALYKHFTHRGLALAGVSTPSSGRMHVIAPMLNLFWDLPVPSFPIRPFVGGGIGAAYVDTYVSSGGAPILTSNNWNLAYQFMAGAMFPLSQSSRITAMYRMFRADDAGFTCSPPALPTTKCKAGIFTQGVDVGFEMDL